MAIGHEQAKRVVDAFNELGPDVDDARLAAFARSELPELVVFTEKALELAQRANDLLANAYSSQDADGIRLNSEDAVKLQWSLQSLGLGGNAGEPCFRDEPEPT